VAFQWAGYLAGVVRKMNDFHTGIDDGEVWRKEKVVGRPGRREALLPLCVGNGKEKSSKKECQKSVCGHRSSLVQREKEPWDPTRGHAQPAEEGEEYNSACQHEVRFGKNGNILIQGDSSNIFIGAA